MRLVQLLKWVGKAAEVAAELSFGAIVAYASVMSTLAIYLIVESHPSMFTNIPALATLMKAFLALLLLWPLFVVIGALLGDLTDHMVGDKSLLDEVDG
jgi:Na+-driven multidrug efflux pump